MNKIAFLLLVAVFSACSVTKLEQKQNLTAKYGYNNYSEAVRDAMIADSNELFDNLIFISPDNTKLRWNSTRDSVLVCSFFNGAYQKSYPVGYSVTVSWGEMWVTTVPELQTAIRSLSNISDKKLRTEQLLGLPPNTKNTHIVEFWVSPNDLFRPAPDKETSDKIANLIYSDFSDSFHRQWFADKLLTSYHTSNPYPWTRMGYTYDWGNPDSEVGLSEFVISKGATIHPIAIYSLDEYLK